MKLAPVNDVNVCELVFYQRWRFLGLAITLTIFSERDYVTFAICYRNSVCRLSVVCDVGAPYSGGCNFWQFFQHTIAQGL